MEHRWGQRIPVSLPVRMTAANIEARGVLRDVSTSGGFIETGVRLPLLSQLEVSLPRAAIDTSEDTLVSAFVVRRTHRGIGVEWSDNAPDGIERLLALLPQPAPGAQATHSAVNHLR